MIVAQAEVENNRADNKLKREQMLMEDDRKRDEFEAEVLLKIAEIEGKYGAQVDVAQINALMERDRESMRQRANVINNLGVPGAQN